MSDDDDEDDEVEELSTRHFGQQPPVDDDDGSGQDAAGEGGESDDSESRMCVRCTQRAGLFFIVFAGAFLQAIQSPEKRGAEILKEEEGAPRR